MQYTQYFPQIIEDLKMQDQQTLFKALDGTLIQQFANGQQELVQLFIHTKRNFIQREIILGCNSLIIENMGIELSRCVFEMRFTKIRNNEGFYIITIARQSYKEFIIAQNQTQFLRIQAHLKRFCVNKNFTSKYQLIDIPGCLPQAKSLKTAELFCLQIWDKRLMQQDKDLDCFHNFITISSGLEMIPQIVKIFEEGSKYYIICQQMKLQSLENLLLNNFDFKEVALVSIIFVVLQIIHKLQIHGLYHNNISLSSIFVNIGSPILQVTLLFPKYCSNRNFKISYDINNIGIILYQLTFYQKNNIKQQIDEKMISSLKTQMQDFNFHQNTFKFLYRISQLDLLQLLLKSDVNIEQALRHQWFVTIKQNLKMEQKPNSIQRQSLNTIIESTNELSMTSSTDRRPIILYLENDVEDEIQQKTTINKPFKMIPSKIKHDLVQYGTKSKTFTEYEIKRESIQLQKQPSLL